MEYYSIPQLVIKTGICDNTIRRSEIMFDIVDASQKGSVKVKTIALMVQDL